MARIPWLLFFTGILIPATGIAEDLAAPSTSSPLTLWDAYSDAEPGIDRLWPSASLPATSPTPAPTPRGPAALEEPWEFLLIPYIWIPRVHLDAGVGNDRESGRVDFSENLERVGLGGFFFYFEARSGQVKFFLESLGVLVRDEFHGRRGDTDVSLNAVLAGLGGGFRIFRSRVSSSTATPAVSLYVTAAMRYAYIWVEVDPEGARGDDDWTDWIDPLFGTHLQLDLAESLFVMLAANIGGFSVGSQFTWGASALAGWEFLGGDDGLGFGVVAGYRMLAIDYEAGVANQKFLVDIFMHGPVVGVLLQF